MTDDNFDDNFDDLFRKNPIANDEPVEVQEVEQHDPRGEDGSNQSEPAEVEAAVAAPDLIDDRDEDEKLPETVPLATFLNVKNSMRDKLKAAEQLAAQHQQRLDEFEKSREIKAPVPDPYLDPRGYTDHRFAELERQRINDKILLSGEMAKRTHGPEAVAVAANWAQAKASTDPTFDAMVSRQADPVEWVIQQHKAATQLDEYQNDPVAAARRIAMEQGWIAADNSELAPAAQAPAANQTPATKVRPTSLKAVPASAVKAATPQSELENLNSLFRKKR